MFELILSFIDYLPTYVSMVSQADMLGDKVNEYQTIMTSANHLLQQMISRIPYLIVASLVFVIFWVLSIFFKKLSLKYLEIVSTIKI